MARYEAYNRAKRMKRRSRFGLSLLDYVVLIITSCCALMLLLSYLARYVNPNEIWAFALLGLVAPVLYIINVILLLYWTLRWRAYLFVPLVVLLIGAGGISLFFRPVLSKHYTEDKQRGSIKVMSYNVMGFMDYSGKEVVSSMRNVVEFINEQKPDILCVQEFQSTPLAPKKKIDSLLSGLPSNTVNYVLKSRSGHGWGIAIYSKYPIIERGVVDFDQSNNSAIWADVVVKTDTIRVLNAHMQTTAINSSDRNYIVSQQFMQEDSMREQRVRSILYKLKQNYKIRAMQADSIAPLIENSPYDVIVCGDFNDTPMSYVYNRIRGDLKDSFIDKGRGVTTTYRGFFNLFRIDYILHSSALETLSYQTPSYEGSDHNPVVVNLKRREP